MEGFTSFLFREFVAPFINAAVEAKRARKEYEELHEIIEAAIQQMRLQREQFEKATSELFAHRQELIDNSFQNLDEAVADKNVNQASAALNNIAKEFSGSKGLTFQTLDEFEDFMNSDEEFTM